MTRIRFSISGVVSTDKLVLGLCLRENGEGRQYFAGQVYDVSDEIAMQMLSLNSFLPRENIQVAADAYHRMYGLTL